MICWIPGSCTETMTTTSCALDSKSRTIPVRRWRIFNSPPTVAVRAKEPIDWTARFHVGLPVVTDCPAVTTWAISAPDQTRVAWDLHADPRTTRRHYNRKNI